MQIYLLHASSVLEWEAHTYFIASHHDGSLRAFPPSLSELCEVSE